MSHSASVRALVSTRSRETSGERCRGRVRNAIPVRSAVVVNTFRCPESNAPPNVGSRKYFCATSQVATSRTCGPARTWGDLPPGSVCCQGMIDSGAGPPTVRAFMMVSQSSGFPELRLAYRRVTKPYSTSWVSVRMSRSSNFRTFGEVVHPGHKAVHRARLNDMLPLSPQEFFVEHALQCGRPQFHGRFQSLAVDGDRLLPAPGFPEFPRPAFRCNRFHAMSAAGRKDHPRNSSGKEISGFRSNRSTRFPVRKAGVQN